MDFIEKPFRVEEVVARVERQVMRPIRAGVGLSGMLDIQPIQELVQSFENNNKTGELFVDVAPKGSSRFVVATPAGEIVALADRANQYIDAKKPWVLAKQEGSETEVHQVCSVGINLFRVLMTYLKPVLPAMADKAEAFLNTSLDWTALEGPLSAHGLSKFKPLITRIDPKQVELAFFSKVPHLMSPVVTPTTATTPMTPNPAAP